MYSFTCMKGRNITNDNGYRTLSGAMRAVNEWQSMGWHVDYVNDDNSGKIAKVIDHNAMRKASETV